MNEALDASVRRANLDDIDALALIGGATFLDSYAGMIHGHGIVAHCAVEHSAAAYRRLLDQPRTGAWLLEIDPGHAPIGYAVVAEPGSLEVEPRPGDLELKRIYLLSRFKRLRLGTGLIDRAVEHARIQGASRLLLGMYGKNDRAGAFYRHHGFVQIGTRGFQVGACRYDDLVFALAL